uniref:COMM domain-containing protein 2 n=1 Tax=Cacopsylla melanoneura TaxID=428564 RepID=A0A8D8ZK56_9HEMI
MIINLNDSHQDHLSILFQLPPQVIQDFCKLATNYLTDGPNQKLYMSISRKLSLPSASNVQDSVEALVYFLLLATILNINEYDLYNTLYNMGFTQDDECKEIVYRFYTQEKYNLYRTLISEYITLLHFRRLEWRFEGIIATRCHLHQSLPKFTVRIHLENSDQQEKQINLEMDTESVFSITKVLEEALSHAKSNQRKMSRRKQLSQGKSKDKS